MIMGNAMGNAHSVFFHIKGWSKNNNKKIISEKLFQYKGSDFFCILFCCCLSFTPFKSTHVFMNITKYNYRLGHIENVLFGKLILKLF